MVKIAILGFGTVGSGVAEVLAMNRESITRKLREPIEVKYILDVRDFPGSPYADRFVKDFSIIENDPEVDVVVETIGGVGAAKDFTRRAMLAGKSVVSSNKELVAEYGHDLLQIAKEKGVSYLFEASVGGGIPILRPLTSCLEANQITDICGILNGTTNYILTRMIQAGLSFDAALKEAQELGYAEQDPTADVDGHDACRKICILAALAYGHHIYPRQVSTIGIRGVTMADVSYADSCGRKIKLLGRAAKLESGKLCVYVEPQLLDGSQPLSSVENVFNAILVTGNAIGDVMFYGQGAGKMPTASAVVADVIDAAKHINQRKYVDWDAGSEDLVVSPDVLQSRWYVRMNASAEQVKLRFGDVAFLARSGAPEGESAFLTPAMTKPELLQKLSGAAAGSLIRVFR